MWWQYFDNMEKELNKSRQTSGQIIIYGHLLILMSLSMVVASIRLLFYMGSNSLLSYIFVFGSLLLYFLSTTIVSHQYRFEQHRLEIYHFFLFLGILPVFFVINLIVVVPNIMIIGQLTLFFIIYAKLTTT